MRKNILAVIIILGLVSSMIIPASLDSTTATPIAESQAFDQKFKYIFLANLGIQTGVIIALYKYYRKFVATLPMNIQKVIPGRSMLRNVSAALTILPIIIYEAYKK